MDHVNRSNLIKLIACFLCLYLTSSELYAQVKPFGFTSGNFSVNESGAGTYIIPLALPPGTGGMQPDLNLVYSSHGSDGIMGVGWTIAGLSTIGLAPATRSQDGENDPVDFDAIDRLQMDGERLSLWSGYYFSNGSEYRTEINDFSRIRYFQQDSSWFEVNTSSGLTREYGTTDDSRLTSADGSHTLFWSLSVIRDTKGNEITFKYTENEPEGEFYPLQITYTTNELAGLHPVHSIDFVYEDRPDIQERYLHTYKLRRTKRLKRIDIKSDGETIRAYSFDYTLDIRSKLVRITEEGRNGQQLSPVEFEWQKSVPLAFTSESGHIDPTLLNSETQVLNADWNRDGLPDLMFYNPQNGSNSFYFNQGDFQFIHDPLFSIPSGRITGGSGIYTGDFNGDLNIDIAWWNKTTGEMRWFISFGGGFTELSGPVVSTGSVQGGSQIYFGEWNADGRTDFMWYHGGTGEIRWFLNESYNSEYKFSQSSGDSGPVTGYNNLQFMDFNADGRTDIFWWNSSTGSNQQFLVKGFDGTKVTTQRSVNPFTPSWLADERHTFRFGDWNSDGLPDYIGLEKETGNNFLSINRSNGEWLAGIQLPLPQNRVQRDSLIVMVNDWNADGFSDIMLADVMTGENWWYINNGLLGFSEKTGLINPSLIGSSKGLIFDDWEGIGSNNLFWYNTTDGTNQWLRNGQRNPNLLKSIREGNSLHIDIDYALLNDTTTYSPYNEEGYHPRYPDVRFNGQVQVVKGYTISNGVGGVNRFSYFYQTGYMNLIGRGFRGFAKVTITDETTGIKNVMLFDRRGQQSLGMDLVKEQQFNQYGTKMSETEYQRRIAQRFFIQSGYFHTTYYTTLDEKTVRSWEPDGTPVATVKYHYDYDDLTNVTLLVVDYGEGHRDSTISLFENDKEKWIIGRLKQIEYYRKLPGGDYQKRLSTFEYDPESGLLTKEILQPENDLLRLTTAYTYDVFGNRTQVTVTGWDGKEEKSYTDYAVYDPTGRFVIEIKNPVGHTETRTYDPAWGNILSQIGVNGLETTWEYDDFGRKVSESYADGTMLQKQYLWCGDGISCPDRGSYMVVSQAPGSPASITYYDLIGREIRSSTEGFDGKRIFLDKEYDNQGNLIRESEPYMEGSTPLWTQYIYDDKRRPQVVMKPGERQLQVFYQGFQTTFYNAEGQRKIKRTDVLGRLKEVEDAQGNLIAYEYDAFGNLVKMTDPEGNEFTRTYDLRGRLLGTNDPGMGQDRYVLDAFGRIINEVNDLGMNFTYEYDDINRIVKRTQPEGTYTWNYDEGEMGVGKISKVEGPDQLVEFKYDEYGRNSERIITIDGDAFETSYTYDEYGRLQEMGYPGGFIVSHTYTARGHLASVMNASTGEVYWRAGGLTSKGRLSSEIFGNGITTEYTYDNATGWTTGIRSVAGQDTIQLFTSSMDKVGNLLSRYNGVNKLEENFTYDNLNRITAAVVGENGPRMEMAYDVLGNITWRTGLGVINYNEDGSGPHALTSVNGENVSDWFLDNHGSGRIDYTSFNKVKQIKTDSLAIHIRYGHSHQRFQRTTEVNGKQVEKRWYIGGLYEKIEKEGEIYEVWYIRGLNRVIASLQKVVGSEESKMLYWHRDHLGSLETLTDQQGQVYMRLSFDPWGQPRNPETWEYGDYTYDSLITRGFTGHEHYSLAALIDMNGRMYDPIIGRFLSPDPFIADIENLQAFNRYSYVLNNPLSYIDPSGYFLDKVFREIGRGLQNVGSEVGRFYDKHREIIIPVVAIGVGVLSGGAGVALLGAQAGTLTFAVASAGGFGFGFAASSTLMAGGTVGDALKAGVKSAVISGITAAATFGVGEAFAHATTLDNVVQKSIAHGLVQGIGTDIQGGEFEHGFYSGAFTTFAAPALSGVMPNNMAGQTAASALVGGTASKLGGGKFVNGAISGAAIMMFNEWGDPSKGARELDREEDLVYLKGYDKGEAKLVVIAEGVATFADGVAIVSGGVTMVAPNPYTTAAGIMATVTSKTANTVASIIHANNGNYAAAAYAGTSALLSTGALFQGTNVGTMSQVIGTGMSINDNRGILAQEPVWMDY